MTPSKLAAVSSIAALCLCAASARAQTLDTTTFVVVGEGLAAGMANYGLSSVVQNQSFPAQIAAQMNTGFPQPLIQPPGIGDVVGYPGQEVRVQTYPQGSVRVFYQPDPKVAASPNIFVLNLSIPGFTLADSTTLRPVPPIAQKNMKQTVVNLILGFPQLFLDNVPILSQFEYAKAMFPTVAMIELGFYEALNAAVAGDPTLMPDPASFGASYGNIIAGLRALQAQVIVTTIPNPIDTAYFSSVSSAASLVQTLPFILTSAYKLSPQDYVTRNGLQAMSNQLISLQLSTLPAGSTLSAATAADITTRVNALNAQIVSAAKANGAVVYDLNAFLHSVKLNGAAVGSRTVTADHLGGFYSMDAIYPSPTGHALIANDILKFLNATYHTSFSLVDVASLAASDPLTQAQKPAGALFTAQSLGLPESGESLQQ